MKPSKILALLSLAAGITAWVVTAAASDPFPRKHGQSGPEYDVLIRNGRVYDGSLDAAQVADVAIKDGRIVQVGRKISGPALKSIDAGGWAVMPGFIDMHTHADRAMTLPEERAAVSFLTQGVTTIVAGQCGTSAWPIFEEAKDQIERWTREGIGPNATLLVGHGSVRRLVMGDDNREPTPEELERMKSLVRDAMEQGASGLSTGLIYMPGRQAGTSEIIELVKIIASYGGIYHSHIRNERDKLLEAVGELIEISEKSGARAHISHFKVLGKTNWGLVKEASVLVEEARARGLEITADQYPYRFSNTSPYSPLIPRQIWAGPASERLGDADFFLLFDNLRDRELMEIYAKATPYSPLSEPHLRFLDGLPRKRLVEFVMDEVLRGRETGAESERERALFLKRLGDPGKGPRIREGVRRHLDQYGPENLIVGISVDRSLEGKSIRDIAAQWGKSVEDAAIALDLMGAKVLPLQMCEPDIEFLMKKDYVATGSDGIAPHYGMGLPHVRSYSTFLYKIGEYVQRRGVVGLNHVVRSQTSLPAEIMRWNDRGRIARGCAADIVVLDLKNIETPSSISRPHQYSRGVRYLFINGELAIDEGRYTGALPGRVLKIEN
ncbi:MAG: amidohydrolase family protein [Candidatus Aminicenantes bacterium]|nr:amidohydrolase family protein [Candidatus Aminicenantes bacterium]